MSTMLISLVVVGACFAVVLWFTIGSVSQPATKDVKPAYGDDPRPASRVITVEAGVPVVEAEGEDDDVAGGGDEDDEAGSASADDSDDEDADADTDADEAPAVADPPTLAAAPVLIVTTDDLGADDAEEPDDGTDPDDGATGDGAEAGRGGRWAEPAMAAGPTVTVERTVPHTAAVAASRPAVDEAAAGQPLTNAPANPRRRRVTTRRRVVNLPGSYSFSPVPPVTAGRRLRSALGVLVVVTVVGLGLAAAVGVLVVAISRALESAVN